MGRITRKASGDREETPKPKRKRRKRDLDRIHTKVLKAKIKLDNTEKNDKNGRKKRGHTKICGRLLPKPAAGIYRNGAKGKNIRKAETSENTYNKARLKADALKLFNGDTPESICIVEIPIHDENDEQSMKKSFVKNSLELTPVIMEQSPILSKRQNQNRKMCLIKKKSEENSLENLNKVKKQNVNDKSKHSTQKENMCKRRLFQNDREQLGATTNVQMRLLDIIDDSKENRVSEKRVQQINSENSNIMSPLNHYIKLGKLISAENFEGDFLQDYQSDPVTITSNRLRHTYADAFRQHLLRKRKQELINVESTPFTLEYQACTLSDNSQLSPVEFEVPKCNENKTIATRMQENIFEKKRKYHPVQNAKSTMDNAIYYNSYLRNISIAYDANNSIVENHESNDNRHAEQSLDIHQFPKSANLYFVNEEDSARLNLQKNHSYINHASKNKPNNKDNFYIDIHDYENPQYIDNSTHLRQPIFSNDSILPAERYLSKDYPREKLLTVITDNAAPNNISQKYKDRVTNKCNVKSVKRIPPILRRGNVIIDKNHSIQIKDDYTKDSYEKYKTNLFDGNPNNVAKKYYETRLPMMFDDIPTHNHAYNNSDSVPLDRTKTLEPQIGSMKIKDSQEFQTEMFTDVCPKKSNLDNFLHPRTFEVSCNANTSTERSSQQEQALNIKKNVCRLHNYRPINYLQSTSSNSTIQQAQRFSQRTKLHTCESNNFKQELPGKNTRDQNQNIIFTSVTSNFSQNTQADKRSRESTCQEMFDKTYVECTKNQNQKACRCNRQRYIYVDSANCPCKCNTKQSHYSREETAQAVAQSEILCNVKGYNDNTNNCINLKLPSVQNVPLPVEQKHHLYRYSKTIDDQHNAVLLQNVTQPIKYLAVKNGPDIQRIPVYINDGAVRVVAKSAPLKVVALMDSNIQMKAFPQEIAAQIIPLQTDNPQFNHFATQTKGNQSFVRHLDPVNAIVFNTDAQANTWYASNL